MPHRMNPVGQAGQGVQMTQMNTLLNDKNLLGDCLVSQKFLANCYNHAITESANEQLRRDFMSIYQEEQGNLKAIFDIMARQGWYNIQYASPQDISQVQSQFQQEMAGGQQFQAMAPGQYQMAPGVQQQQFAGGQYGQYGGQQLGGQPGNVQQPYRTW